MVRKYSCYDNEEEMNRKNCILLKKNQYFFFHFIRRFVICNCITYTLMFYKIYICIHNYISIFCLLLLVGTKKPNTPPPPKKTSTSCEIQLLNTKVQWQEGDFHTCRKQSISIHSSPTENMKLYDDSKE